MPRAAPIVLMAVGLSACPNSTRDRSAGDGGFERCSIFEDAECSWEIEDRVGEACTVELVPPGGFVASESYLETSSVSCATRVCLVYEFGGDPSETREACESDGSSGCSELPTADEVHRSVYCTCRCAVPDDSTATPCSCPTGFTCGENLLSLGGSGIRGGYCIRDEG